MNSQLDPANAGKCQPSLTRTKTVSAKADLPKGRPPRLRGAGCEFIRRQMLQVVIYTFLSDDGKNWGEPICLAAMPMWDGGYPSSVERADGTIVTAFYAAHPERGENQYQMDVVLWRS